MFRARRSESNAPHGAEHVHQWQETQRMSKEHASVEPSKKKRAKRTMPSAEDIAEAVSAKLKRDAYWAEVDAYYKERAK